MAKRGKIVIIMKSSIDAIFFLFIISVFWSVLKSIDVLFEYIYYYFVC
jgi:hypothetical protein